MAKIPQNNPPADQPNYGGPFNFKWFKFHHLRTLENHYNALENQYKRLPLGEGYSQEEIKIMLVHLDELIKLFDYLPDTRGGQGTMNEVIKSRDSFKSNYLNKDLNKMSFLDVQDIIFNVFTIYNYMNALCED